MLRGSRPGERRGGRKRGTPNRRTILSDRILSIGLDQPAASQHAFLLKLVQDQKLPADIRMAVAPKCFPPNRTRSSWRGRPRALSGRRTTNVQEGLVTAGSASKGSQVPTGVPAVREWAPHAIDALFSVVQDGSADRKARRKAALKITELLLPKVGKKAKVIPDEYGFAISPNLASAYRDIQLERRTLGRGPTRKIPANAEKIKRLEARSDAIRRRLQLACPSKYGDKEAHADSERLAEFITLRGDKTALTEAQEAEEAHLRARFDVFCASPELIARRRLKALEDADRRFRMCRFMGESSAPPLSRRDRNDLKLLRWLYPKPKQEPSQPNGDDRLELEMYLDHPFVDELRAPNGNFYPRRSKLRWLEQLGNIEQLTPAEDAEDQLKPRTIRQVQNLRPGTPPRRRVRANGA
jgi:hypothetical protein